MSTKEIVWTVLILLAGYYFFVVRGGMGSGHLRGRISTGRAGTVGGGGSKRYTTRHNSNARTNAQQGNRYNPAPIAYAGPGWDGGGNVGGTRAQGWRSTKTDGLVGSFVANQWPTMQVFSTGYRRIGAPTAQVPSYTAVPLTVQGVGGGGSIVADA
jgi:hypothetical protein